MKIIVVAKSNVPKMHQKAVFKCWCERITMAVKYTNTVVYQILARKIFSETVKFKELRAAIKNHAT